MNSVHWLPSFPSICSFFFIYVDVGLSHAGQVCCKERGSSCVRLIYWTGWFVESEKSISSPQGLSTKSSRVLVPLMASQQTWCRDFLGSNTARRWRPRSNRKTEIWKQGPSWLVRNAFRFRPIDWAKFRNCWWARVPTWQFTLEWTDVAVLSTGSTCNWNKQSEEWILSIKIRYRIDSHVTWGTVQTVSSLTD